MKVVPGGLLGHKWVQGMSRCEEKVLALHCLLLQKVQMNLITPIRVWVSSPPMIVLTAQIALPDWQNTIRKSPIHINVWDKKSKSNY